MASSTWNNSLLHYSTAGDSSLFKLPFNLTNISLYKEFITSSVVYFYKFRSYCGVPYKNLFFTTASNLGNIYNTICRWRRADIFPNIFKYLLIKINSFGFWSAYSILYSTFSKKPRLPNSFKNEIKRSERHSFRCTANILPPFSKFATN